MAKIYRPTVYSNLIALRKQLADAYVQNDPSAVDSLNGQIDRLQLEYWIHECLKTAS